MRSRGLQRVADRAGFDEADQAVGEDRGLGQRLARWLTSGREVIHAGAPAVRSHDAVADELLVQGHVREWAPPRAAGTRAQAWV